ncbi:MAG: hypothetical protein RLZZ618_1876 [Pseudomonadota bacterium]
MTLVELMVAIVIFSFGMLGLAGLQTKTLATSQSGLYRTQATALAADALDQMRSAVAAARGGSWNTGLTDSASTIALSTGGLVDTALPAWKRAIEAQLPNGRGRIAVAARVGTESTHVVTVQITWDDSRGREAATSFTTVSRL